MEADFKIIGITLADVAVDNEAERITRLLCSGAVDRMHIRKPCCSADIIANVLEAIPRELHKRLSLHDVPELLEKYPDVGFHFNSRYPSGVSATVLSRSCHSAAEVLEADAELEYVTLSPVFDSLSKSGYKCRTFHNECEAVATRKVVALGGVTPSRFPELKERGFSGAAMLGYLWNPLTDIENIIEEIHRWKNCNS